MSDTNLLRCVCPHCSVTIEYPPELSEGTADCPACVQAVLFPPAPAPVSKAASFFGGLRDSWKEAQQRRGDRKQFKAELLSAVSDGDLTVEEVATILSRKSELQISEEDFRKMGREVYEAAFNVAARDGAITPEEEDSLLQIKRFLRLPDSEITDLQTQLRQLVLVWRIRYGEIPQIPHPGNVIFKAGEKPYWAEPGELYEERVVSSRYEGGSSGVSVRIMKGVSFRVGAQKGRLVSDKEHVPIDSGMFIVTSQRLLYSGMAKSFATPFEKLMDINVHADGITYGENAKQKKRSIRFRSDNGPIILEIISRAVREI